MKINFDVINTGFNIKQSPLKINEDRSHYNKYNISFNANPVKINEKITLLDILKIQRSINANLEALNTIINGQNNNFKANVSVRGANTMKNSASRIYDVFSLAGASAGDAICPDACEYSRLSELLGLPGTNLSKFFKPDEAFQITINPETINKDLADYRQNIKEALLSLQNPEVKDSKGNLDNLKKAGDVLRQATTYFYALGAHFYDKAGNKSMADLFSNEAQVMASFQKIYPY